MRSIIEELYHASIDPETPNNGRDLEYSKAFRMCDDREEKLMAKLNPGEKELFESYRAAQNHLESLIHLNTFSYAFKTGILLAMEILMEKRSLSDDN